MNFDDNQIVEMEELFDKFQAFYNKEFSDREGEDQCYVFRSKNEPEAFFKFKAKEHSQVEIVRNDTPLITREFKSAIQTLKYWFIKFQPQSEQSFSQFQLSSIKLLGSEHEEFCMLQIISKHRARFFSYYNPDHFFEMIPLEENGVKIKRELIFKNGSYQTSERGFENCMIVLNSWISDIKKNYDTDVNTKNKILRNKEIFKEIEIETNLKSIGFEPEPFDIDEVVKEEKSNHDEFNAQINFKELVIETKEHLRKETAHKDIRPFWSKWLDDDQMVEFRINLAIDEIIDQLNTDNWKILLTVHRGHKLTPDQLDENGRFIEKKSGLRDKESPFGNKTANWIMGILLTIILAIMPLAYEQGKDTYSNEKIKWLDENSKLRERLNQDSVEKQQMAKKLDSLITAKKSDLTN